MRMALRYPTGFLALRDVAQRLHDASITGEMPFDGERWIRYHDYHGEWFRRALPGFELPRQFDQLRSEAYILAALDALEQGDRRRGRSRLVSAVRAYPRSLFNPRVAAATLALLLGRRGTDALAQRRSARRERSETLVYEPAGTGSV